MSDRILSPRRAAVHIGVGIVVGICCAAAGEPALAPLAAWCTAGGAGFVRVWRRCWHQDAEGTERLAHEEAESKLTDNTVVVACLVSLVTVVLALAEATHARDLVSIVAVFLGVAGTFLAWAIVNTVYALKYARMYHLDHDHSGFETGQQEPPTYSDFAYLAFTIGMAYSAPEVQPSDTGVRRKALPHALLSYFFGTVLIAVAINAVTSIGQG